MINTEGPWLFISCDLPLVNKSTLERLFYFRNANKTATVFVHLNTGIPEPLCAIYESNSKPALIKWFESGNTSMRLFLQNSNVEKILLKDTTELQSMNTPEQYEKLRLLN
jgi:molybdopterin-guanine dinucleotide biosynthesis protein A